MKHDTAEVHAAVSSPSSFFNLEFQMRFSSRYEVIMD